MPLRQPGESSSARSEEYSPGTYIFPIRHIDIVASGTVNGVGACYRVAYGVEHRGDEHALVYKILVCSHGKVTGRLNPAFPHGSDDFARVVQAMAELSTQVARSSTFTS